MAVATGAGVRTRVGRAAVESAAGAAGCVLVQAARVVATVIKSSAGRIFKVTLAGALRIIPPAPAGTHDTDSEIVLFASTNMLRVNESDAVSIRSSFVDCAVAYLSCIIGQP